MRFAMFYQNAVCESEPSEMERRINQLVEPRDRKQKENAETAGDTCPDV